MNDLQTAYGARAGARTAEYPNGSFLDAVAKGTGTPFDSKFFNDIAAFTQKLVAEAGITPNNVTDTVVASQLFDAFRTIADRSGSKWLGSQFPADCVAAGGNSVFNVGGASTGAIITTIIKYNNATYNAVTSDDGGSTWQRASATNFEWPTAIAASDTTMVILSSKSGITTTAYYSTDGITWNSSTGITSWNQVFYDMIYDGTRFIATNDDGSINTSVDGITWNEVAITLPQSYGIAHNSAGVVIATGDADPTTGERLIRSIDNGQTWTLISTPDDTIPYKSVTYGNGRWIAFPANSASPKSLFAYSDDEGATWTVASMPSEQYDFVEYTPVGFLAPYTDNEERVMYSNDGIVWYSLFIPEATFLDVALGRPFVSNAGATFITAGNRVLIGGA